MPKGKRNKIGKLSILEILSETISRGDHWQRYARKKKRNSEYRILWRNNNTINRNKL